jgi:hypothetical protein
MGSSFVLVLEGKAPHLSQDSDEKGLLVIPTLWSKKGRSDHDTIDSAEYRRSKWKLRTPGRPVNRERQTVNRER